MNYDDARACLPDDDPQGDARLERDLAESCPDCGVDADTPCTTYCDCRYCRSRDLREQDARQGVA